MAARASLARGGAGRPAPACADGRGTERAGRYQRGAGDHGEGREQVHQGDLLSRLVARTPGDRMHVVPRLISSDPSRRAFIYNALAAVAGDIHARP